MLSTLANMKDATGSTPLDPTCSPKGYCYGPQSNTWDLGVLCSLALKHCPALNVNDINVDNAIVSDGATHQTIVGAQQNLTLTASPAAGQSGTFAVSEPQWTLPNTYPIAGYTYAQNSSSAQALSDSALQSIPLVFYHTWGGSWDNGGTGSTQSINASAVATSADGSEISVPTAQAIYFIARPSVSDNSVSNGPVEVGSYDPQESEPALSYGNNSDPYLTMTDGTYFNYQVTFPSNYSGEIGLTQLVNEAVTTTAAPSQPSDPYAAFNTGGQYELDTCLQYTAPVSGDSTTATYNMSTVDGTYDAPDFGLNESYYTSVTGSESFDDYYMFKPALANSIWVGLFRFRWSWNGTATFSPPWALNGQPSNSSIGFLALEQPQWNQVQSAESPPPPYNADPNCAVVQ